MNIDKEREELQIMIDKEHIRECLTNLSKCMLAGRNEIHLQVVEKSLGPLVIILSIMKTGNIPEDCGRAKVVPIFQKRGKREIVYWSV